MGIRSWKKKPCSTRDMVHTQVDSNAMAYYRYERIIEDIAVICDQIFLTDEGGEDRRQHFGYLKSNFLPNHTIDIAYRSDKS